MQSVAYFSILLAFATLALVASQVPQQEQPGNSASPIVESAQVVPQQHQQSGVVVSSAPVPVHPEQQGPVVGPVEHHQIHHQAQQQYPHHQQFQGASHYAPAGMIQVVGDQQQGVKPVVGRSVEQYGQPESAALPPNYKPFGSWGLYIGGNPADGYYTNYYKQLSSSVEKAQGEQSPKPSSALSPMLRQASGMSPFSGGDYYPFAYSMNDLSSSAAPRSYVAPNVQVENQFQNQQSPVVGPVHYAAAVSPVQAGAQVYGSPASFESNHYGVSPYSGVEAYAATKKLGSSYVQQKEATKAAEVPLVQAPVQLPAKGYQYQYRYVYPQQVGPLSAPVAFSPVGQALLPSQQQLQHPQQHQQQVVAYPVPVASQIVGSQAGVDGAFAPYGVHAFTRYAVKPAVVGASEQQSYHYGVSSQLPAYKQQQSASVYSSSQSNGPHAQYYSQPPFSYYGYPLNQLHYSQGSIVPAVHGGEPIYHSPSVVGGGSQVEASEKSETSSSEVEKSQLNTNKQQQMRA